MAASKAVSTSWTLSQTATDVVGVSRGMLEAATTDNVSMLALLACEAFGALLPMSIETKAKMHQKCSQDHQSAVLSFLKAQIGYKRGDSGWQLARSDSGLRFLGLATCLLSTDLWTSAELLRELITETAEDKMLVPTSQQLKGLLLVLQNRLANAGFLNDVLGWNLLLYSRIDVQSTGPKPPSNEVIQKLIKCMSSMARIGDASKHQTLKVKIPHSQAAWTIAFLKWCLGTPPRVIRDDGHVIIPNNSSQAELYPMLNPRLDDVEISLWDDLGSVSELFQGLRDGLDHTRGMVSAQCYLDTLCQLYGPKNSPYYINAMKLIPYACHKVWHSLSDIRLSDVVTDQSNHVRETLLARGIQMTRGNILSDEEIVLQALRKVHHDGQAYSLKKTPNGSIFTQLPPAVALRKLVRMTCPCKDCLATAIVSRHKCDFERWLQRISYHVGTLLLLSMMVSTNTTEVSLHYNLYSLSYETEFTSKIYTLLVGEQGKGCSVDAVIHALLHLVGHTDIQSINSRTWIASSHLGQTIYPQLLQSMHVKPKGLLTVLCIPGSLSWNNVDYKRVEMGAMNMYEQGISVSEDYEDNDSSDAQKLIPPVTAEDEYPSPELRWRVSGQDNKLLLGVFASNLSGYPQRDSLQALRSMTDSIFVSCPHDEHGPCSDEHLWQASPQNPANSRPAPAVAVIQTYHNEVMRYFSLCSLVSCVIRDQACLDCCVLVARQVGLRVILC